MMAMTVAASASSGVSNRCWHRVAVARVMLYSARRTACVARVSRIRFLRVRARYVSSGRWSRAASTTSSRLRHSLRHLCLDVQALRLAPALGASTSVAHWCRSAANGEAVVADIELPFRRSALDAPRGGLRAGACAIATVDVIYIAATVRCVFVQVRGSRVTRKELVLFAGRCQIQRCDCT